MNSIATPEAARAPARGALASFEAGFVRVNRWAVIALMASMALLVFGNVVSRYVFNRSIIWVEEFTQFEMIWVAFLGAGLALREGRHVAVDTLQDLLPDASRVLLRHAIACAMAVFLAVLVVLGLQIVAFTWNQETPVLGVPTGAPYLAVPIGAALMLVHLLLVWRPFVARAFEHAEDANADAEAEAAA